MSQGKYTLQGLIQDSISQAVAHATVTFIMGSDTLHTVTDKNGEYLFSVRPPTAFELWVTRIGYQPYKKKFRVKNPGPSLRLGPILLRTDFYELDPVIVNRIRPLTIGVDTTTYHAGAFPVKPGAELESLLKRLPGLEVDLGGNLIVQGKKIGRVMVDGKSFFGGNVLTATRNLPADIIDQIQIIDDYGDKARLTGVKSGEPTKVLNLILKQEKRNGRFGHFQAGAGNKDKYAADAFANSFAGERQISLTGSLDNNSPAGNTFGRQVGLSYGSRWSPKWKVEGNISLSGDDPRSSSSQIADNYYGSGQLHQEQANRLEGHSNSANGSSTFTYTPDVYHTLRISATANRQLSKQSTTTNFVTLQHDSSVIKSTQGASVYQSNSINRAAGSELYFEQLSSHSKRRFNALINFHISYNSQKNDNSIISTLATDTPLTNTNQHYLSDNSAVSWAAGTQINYFLPLGKTGYLELGYTFSQMKNQSNKSTRQKDSIHPAPILIDSLSQRYLFQSLNQQLHIGYNIHVEKLNLSATLDCQPGYFSGDPSGKGLTTTYHYFDWLPNLQGSYQLSKSKTVSVQYNSSSLLPGLQQVQPVTDLSNPQYPVFGNPNLKNGFSQNISLHYEQSSLKPLQFFGFGGTVGYNNVRDAIVAEIIHPKDNSSVIQETSYTNINGQHGYYLNYHVSLPEVIHRYLRIMLSGDINSSRLITLTDHMKFPMQAFTVSQSLHLQWLMAETVESEWSASYTYSKSRYPSAEAPGISSSNLGWEWQSKLYLLHYGVLSSQMSQTLTQSLGGGWQSVPLLWISSFEWRFGKNNCTNLRITGYDLLNSATGISQSIGPTSVSKSQTMLVGRYYMASFIWKWGKFKA
jgi:hypothetical protein